MSDERAKGLESTITPERLFQAAAHNPEIAKKVGIPTAGQVPTAAATLTERTRD